MVTWEKAREAWHSGILTPRSALLINSVFVQHFQGMCWMSVGRWPRTYGPVGEAAWAG